MCEPELPLEVDLSERTELVLRFFGEHSKDLAQTLIDKVELSLAPERWPSVSLILRLPFCACTCRAVLVPVPILARMSVCLSVCICTCLCARLARCSSSAKSRT
jgi:hypothetical protein